MTSPLKIVVTAERIGGMTASIALHDTSFATCLGEGEPAPCDLHRAIRRMGGS
ncbi:hypothetical protein ACFQH9_31930 [Pseudonocardia lutea]|uniref:Uncharacterized protein n=1 Tax=Pseudonocardia lutea TaxID=2172015 RepID=A0ABW1IJ26_9PSEU